MALQCGIGATRATRQKMASIHRFADAAVGCFLSNVQNVVASRLLTRPDVKKECHKDRTRQANNDVQVIALYKLYIVEYQKRFVDYVYRRLIIDGFHAISKNATTYRMQNKTLHQTNDH